MIERLIVPPLTFFEVEIEVLLDAVEFAQATFGETPEGFDSVDVHPVESEMLALVDPEMLVVTDVDQAIAAFPPIRVYNAFGILASPDDVLKRLGRAVGDDFGIDPAVSLIDPKHRLLECPAASLSRSRPSPDTRRTEEAFVDLDHPHKLGFFLSLVGMDQGPEDPEIAIDGLPVQSQQLGGFRRIDVDAKTRDNFFDPIGADIPVFKHFSRPSENF